MNELATLGGGCYWCLEAFYQRIQGIVSVTSGYSGGTVDNPSVQRVYQGDTGHAEVVQLKFDPTVITFREVLEIFFVMHDPTTVDRQGNDVGDEYRSVVFYHSDEQRDTVRSVLEQYATPLWPNPIVTQVRPYTTFWPADESMQDFYDRNPNVGYCQAVIDPKIQKLRQKFAAKLR